MYKLGRKAIIKDSRTLKLEKYLTSILPTAPLTRLWSKNVSNWGVMLNNTLGCCTISGIGHAVQTWTLNVSTEITVPDSIILQYYENWDGYINGDPSTDQGGIELNVLKSFKKNGFDGHKIEAFASVNPQNITEVKQAINLFGGLYIGMDVPNYIMNGIPSIWDINQTADNSIDGGHAVYVVGYDQTYITFISWGSLYKMTIPYWQKFVDESYCIISDDWFNKSGVDPTGLNILQLKSDLALIH